jgi:putative CocE/NonD family hydrolase
MPHKYPNMRTHDSKALTYTTPPLDTEITIVGHPVVHIWLNADAPDLDAFVYLEEVDGNGDSTYITEGELRASHRQLSQAPFGNFGLPWHNYFQSEVQPIPAGEPIELVFDLRPTAWQFSPGKRIRITIAFADSDNFGTPVLEPAPILQILRDMNHLSYIEMPVAQMK